MLRTVRGEGSGLPSRPASPRSRSPRRPSCSSRPPRGKPRRARPKPARWKPSPASRRSLIWSKRIGGPHVRVEVLVQPGQDPHIFEPTPRQVVRLSKARLFFKIGMPFEDRLTDRISADNANIKLVEVSAGIKHRAGVDPDEDAGADPHVWLSPKLLKRMAANIAAALSAADPPHAHDYYEIKPLSMPNSTPSIAAWMPASRPIAGRRFTSSIRPSATSPTPTA